MLKNIELRYFSKNNMKHQLITLFICAVAIPVFSIGSILSILTYRNTISHYEDLADSQEKLIQSAIVSTSIYLHSIYQNVFNNMKLKELLCTDDSEFDSIKATSEIVGEFDSMLANTAMLTSLQLYAPAELMDNVAPNKYILPVTDELTDFRWYQKSQKISGNFWISDTRTGQNNVNYWELHYCCRIPFPQENTHAVLVLSVSNDYLRNLISNRNYQIYISVNDEPIFISSDRSYAGQNFPLNLENEADSLQTGTFTLFGKKVIGSLASPTLYRSLDKLHIFVADINALDITRRLIIIFVLIILLAMLVSGSIVLLYATYFSGRINTLRLAMYKVSNNDYEIVDTIRGDDELTATFRDMKTMVKKLKNAEAEIYKAQIREQMIQNQQQQMELKLLANQINPHFLYNTLEAIRMKAFVEGNKEVATAIKLLSKSMRYVLGNTQTTSTTLEKELDYIATYMAIMKLRFGSRINYDLRIEEDLQKTDYLVLPIMLQPVIENAISHGLMDLDEEGHIILKICSSKDKSLLYFHVFDNGTGMTKEKLAKVISHLDTPVKDSGHGVGLYNVNNRIRLFYGPEYGLTIKSKKNFGTCVTITIPLYNFLDV